MKIDLAQHPVQHNPERRRFEVKVEGKTAVAEYIQTKEKLFLTHTEVPKGLEGNGIGSHLAVTALTYAKDNGLVVMPLCPYMAGYIARHSEWKTILAPGVNVG
ncbi:MAG: N-acetyltransferase [Phaeodactylibacter sp.]|nr:N-acetyltransferase [Phaeodactylibacter sp.]